MAESSDGLSCREAAGVLPEDKLGLDGFGFIDVTCAWLWQTQRPDLRNHEHCDGEYDQIEG